ncbi:hypothetical protein PsorP6_012227 [Peronosclerospora sorghi]|uniref:Uncharacterized protein n=1 Tax=Peronosclerospora sorghi TaxID=230839 RepID=A0ACC0WJK5_9STRA|nr:hypothetical protein PsorP6_012227 [Peronosclerospora sorghi]
MSISVSRESISKLMGELVDTFPIEAEGRSSISDFGKLLFTEGQGSSTATANASINNIKCDTTGSDVRPQTGSKRVFTEIKGVPRQKQHDIMKTKDKAVPKRWTQEEDDKLREAVGRHGERNWKSIAEEVPGRNHTQCLQRWTKVLAPGLVKGHWRPDEDELLKELVAEGRKNWGQVATRIPGRTSKQCRERWYNHLDPSIIRGEYTHEEDQIILDAQARLGNRWSAIAAMLPGRTEDAVKIRWKSLCRVRKGQGRRGQTDKSKINSKIRTAISGQMMQQHGRPGFENGIVKSEEVTEFSLQHGAHLMRLQNGQIVPAATNMPSINQHQHQSIMSGNGMMYPPTDMSGGGYDPTMLHYRKPAMQQHIRTNGYEHPLPPGGPIPSTHPPDFATDRRSPIDYSRSNLEYPVERRSNVNYGVEHRSNMPLSSMPPSSQEEYCHGYPSSSSTYGPTLNSAMCSTGPSSSSGSTASGHMYSNAPQMDTYRPGAIFGSQMPTHSQHSHMMAYNYGVPPGHSSPECLNGEHSSSHSMLSSMNNPSYASPHHRQQEVHHYVDRSPPIPRHNTPHHRQMHHHIRAHEDQQPHPEKELQNQSRMNEEQQVKQEPAPRLQSSQLMQNPAATFARRQAGKEPSPAAASNNPVAAFLQMQHNQKRNDQSSGTTNLGAPTAFNPAAAFAQRFQATLKPPMRSNSSTNVSKSTENTAEEDDDGETGSGYRTGEPSLKKVKPRLSIDAARASAARRMRSSGTSGNLAGRGSLDVFLNEIGDVGRLSDLKMDEFQTLDELWRVSGDMDRLSL